MKNKLIESYLNLRSQISDKGGATVEKDENSFVQHLYATFFFHSLIFQPQLGLEFALNNLQFTWLSGSSTQYSLHWRKTKLALRN